MRRYLESRSAERYDFRIQRKITVTHFTTTLIRRKILLRHSFPTFTYGLQNERTRRPHFQT